MPTTHSASSAGGWGWWTSEPAAWAGRSGRGKYNPYSLSPRAGEGAGPHTVPTGTTGSADEEAAQKVALPTARGSLVARRRYVTYGAQGWMEESQLSSG